MDAEAETMAMEKELATNQAVGESESSIAAAVPIAPLDCSADGFLAAVKTMAALSGEPAEESIEASERERFLSTLSFSTEWREFYYEPINLDFAYENESGEEKHTVTGTSLPQFSSAMVPEFKQLPERTRFCSSNDFVLHSGGSVWALDWCPRLHEKPDHKIKCEYLAVSVHPPGSAYHQMGAPLVGRGAIQIWCLLNDEDSLSLLNNCLHGKSRKKNAKSNSSALKTGENSIPKRPRGRPRKTPAMNEIACPTGAGGAKLKRPIGRPRKLPSKSLDGINVKQSSLRTRGRPRKILKPDQQNLSRMDSGSLGKQNAACGNDFDEVESSSPNLTAIDCIHPQIIEFGAVSACPDYLNERALCANNLDGSREKKSCSTSPTEKPRMGRNLEQQKLFQKDQTRIGGNKANDCVYGKEESPMLDMEPSDCILPLNIEFGAVSTPPANLTEQNSGLLKRRGRPRKIRIPDLEKNDELCSRSLEFDRKLALTLNDHVVPLNIIFPEKIQGSVSLKGKETVTPKHKGRLKKKPVPCLDSGIQQGEELPRIVNEKSIGPGHKEIPKEDQTPNMLYNDQSLDATSLHTHKDPVLDPITSLLPLCVESENISSVSTNFGEGDMPRKRSRKNNIISCVNNQASAIGSFSPNNDLNLVFYPPLSITLKEMDSFSENLHKEDSTFARCRGRRRKKPCPCLIDKDVQAVGTQSPQIVNEVNHKDRMGIISGEITPGPSTLNGKTCISKTRISKRQVPPCRNTVNACSDNNPVDIDLMSPASVSLSKNQSFCHRFGRTCGISQSTSLLSAQEDKWIDMMEYEPFAGGLEFPDSDAIFHARSKENDQEETLGNFNNLMLPTVREHGELSTRALPAQNHFKDSKLTSQTIQKISVKDHMFDLIPEEFSLPRLVLCLFHNEKVAWDVKWRPLEDDGSYGICHMGFLAVLLGNGSLEVWEVPLPILVKSLYASCCSDATDPRFMKLNPVFKSSKIKCGDRQCIPLTLEWSPAAPHDLILAGCHDGVVALWKFNTESPFQDSKPLLCFTADTAPIRAVAWAPDGSDPESTNLIATAGSEGLKFWDIRDQIPLWHLTPQSTILSLQWLKDPGCIIMTLDDGTVKTLSTWQAASTAAFATDFASERKKAGLSNICALPFAVWSVHVSPTTGMAAYCTADGFAFRCQLTAKPIAGRKRKDVQHALCGSIVVAGQSLKVKTPLSSDFLVTNRKKNAKQIVNNEHGYGKEQVVMEFPNKFVALHKIRWNINRGAERWLCYGGAAGIVRCRKIVLADA